MKITFRQNKPKLLLHAIGVLCLMAVIADIVILCQWNSILPSRNGNALSAAALLSVLPCIVTGLLTVPPVVVEVDTDDKYYTKRLYLGVFSVVISRKKLPRPDYISVFRQLYTQGDDDAEAKVSDYKYLLNLWTDNTFYTLSTFYTAKDAVIAGRKTALAFNCRLLNATDPDSTLWETLEVEDGYFIDATA